MPQNTRLLLSICCVHTSILWLAASCWFTYMPHNSNQKAALTLQLIPTFNRPEQPIKIYEFDACPFCKKVREMVNYLDLDVLFCPCPKDGPNFRPEAIKKGGKSMFPYMEDPNTGTSMYESDDIIKYLADKYGDGTVPTALKLGPLTAITCGLSGIGR
jgi:glutaredoxin